MEFKILRNDEIHFRGFLTRAAKLLARAGKTPEDTTLLTWAELLRIRGMGAATARVVRRHYPPSEEVRRLDGFMDYENYWTNGDRENERKRKKRAIDAS